MVWTKIETSSSFIGTSWAEEISLVMVKRELTAKMVTSWTYLASSVAIMAAIGMLDWINLHHLSCLAS